MTVIKRKGSSDHKSLMTAKEILRGDPVIAEARGSNEKHANIIKDIVTSPAFSEAIAQIDQALKDGDVTLSSLIQTSSGRHPESVLKLLSRLETSGIVAMQPSSCEGLDESVLLPAMSLARIMRRYKKNMLTTKTSQHWAKIKNVHLIFVSTGVSLRQGSNSVWESEYHTAFYRILRYLTEGALLTDDWLSRDDLISSCLDEVEDGNGTLNKYISCLRKDQKQAFHKIDTTFDELLGKQGIIQRKSNKIRLDFPITNIGMWDSFNIFGNRLIPCIYKAPLK